MFSDSTICKFYICCVDVFKVTVVEVQNLKNVNGGKIVFCTMEIEGDKRLQTDHAEANKPQSVYVLAKLVGFGRYKELTAWYLCFTISKCSP